MIFFSCHLLAVLRYYHFTLRFSLFPLLISLIILLFIDFIEVYRHYELIVTFHCAIFRRRLLFDAEGRFFIIFDWFSFRWLLLSFSSRWFRRYFSSPTIFHFFFDYFLRFRHYFFQTLFFDLPAAFIAIFIFAAIAFLRRLFAAIDYLPLPFSRVFDYVSIVPFHFSISLFFCFRVRHFFFIFISPLFSPLNIFATPLFSSFDSLRYYFILLRLADVSMHFIDIFIAIIVAVM